MSPHNRHVAVHGAGTAARLDSPRRYDGRLIRTGRAADHTTMQVTTVRRPTSGRRCVLPVRTCQSQADQGRVIRRASSSRFSSPAATLSNPSSPRRPLPPLVTARTAKRKPTRTPSSVVLPSPNSPALRPTSPCARTSSRERWSCRTCISEVQTRMVSRVRLQSPGGSLTKGSMRSTVRALLNSMLHPLASSRCTTHEALQSAWFKSSEAQLEELYRRVVVKRKEG